MNNHRNTYGWNFTPFFDFFQDIDKSIALTFGKIWRYAQNDGGKCTASLGRIAGELGYSVKSTITAITFLEDAGLIVDETPDVRNRPHVYHINYKIVDALDKKVRDDNQKETKRVCETNTEQCEPITVQSVIDTTQGETITEQGEMTSEWCEATSLEDSIKDSSEYSSEDSYKKEFNESKEFSYENSLDNVSDEKNLEDIPEEKSSDGGLLNPEIIKKIHTWDDFKNWEKTKTNEIHHLNLLDDASEDVSSEKSIEHHCRISANPAFTTEIIDGKVRHFEENFGKKVEVNCFGWILEECEQ